MTPDHPDQRPPPPTAPPTRCRPRPRTTGFNLIEAALVTVIIGTGFMAMLGLITTGTAANAEAGEMVTAVNLANSVREMTLRLSFTDPAFHWGLENGETIMNCNNVEDLDGAVFSPPVDAARTPIANLTTWTQTIDVQSVDLGSVETETPNDSQNNPIMRVTCVVANNGVPVYEQEWLIINPGP